ncbi:hypothetical protein B0H11DRAFT_1937477 [Mycena galericulata]|nr:hypothetical protein B0H11DRAFT_1937477 [Mycena galericulata]
MYQLVPWIICAIAPRAVAWLLEDPSGGIGALVVTLATAGEVDHVANIDASGYSQGATAMDENGEGIQVLFDVMTHTLDGFSGIGDHGKPGINKLSSSRSIREKNGFGYIRKKVFAG